MNYVLQLAPTRKLNNFFALKTCTSCKSARLAFLAFSHDGGDCFSRFSFVFSYLPASLTALETPGMGPGRTLRSMDNRGQQGHRPKVLGRQLPASIARSPPLGREQRHQHRRAVSPLGALDTAVAFSEISDEKRDDGSSTNAITRISEAPPAEPRERRVVDVDSGKVKGGGKSRSSKSVRQFFRRKSSEVLSYLTIMATWLLFRFLLKGLNKVTEWLSVFCQWGW